MCRGIQGHPHGIFWRLHVLYQQYVYSVVFEWFMYQQYVYGVASCCPLVVYELYILCYVFDYKNIFYRGMGWGWVNQHSMHLNSVTLSKMLRLG